MDCRTHISKRLLTTVWKWTGVGPGWECGPRENRAAMTHGRWQRQSGAVAAARAWPLAWLWIQVEGRASKEQPVGWVQNWFTDFISETKTAVGFSEMQSETNHWVQQVQVFSDSGKCHPDGKLGMSESSNPEGLRKEGRLQTNTNGHKEKGQK